jgi:hypothetical protein
MSTALAIYLAIGVTIGILLGARGWRAGRLRWYNILFAFLAWPIVIVGGIVSARRMLRE